MSGCPGFAPYACNGVAGGGGELLGGGIKILVAIVCTQVCYACSGMCPTMAANNDGGTKLKQGSYKDDRVQPPVPIPRCSPPSSPLPPACAQARLKYTPGKSTFKSPPAINVSVGSGGREGRADVECGWVGWGGWARVGVDKSWVRWDRRGARTWNVHHRPTRD